jgi:spermidine/putrescine transport system ATP-binding protein
MSASVELRGVSKRYGNILAVDDVSLIVRAGEFLTLLGPSGCGKTTLLRVIAGFVAPDSGTVLIGDADVTAVSPNRRDVNQVFQSYALFPHLSVNDNIAFGLKMQRRSAAEIRRRVREVVSLVALEGCERTCTGAGGAAARRTAIGIGRAAAAGDAG